jgi:hypothetical protein
VPTDLDVTAFEHKELGRLGMPQGIMMRHRPAHFARKMPVPPSGLGPARCVADVVDSANVAYGLVFAALGSVLPLLLHFHTQHDGFLIYYSLADAFLSRRFVTCLTLLQICSRAADTRRPTTSISGQKCWTQVCATDICERSARGSALWMQ